MLKHLQTLGRKGSPRVQSGRKVAKRNYMKMRREMQSMKCEINKKAKKIETLRKQVYRLKARQSSDISPGKKVKIIGKKKVSPAIRKKLLLGFALMSGLSNAKKNMSK